MLCDRKTTNVATSQPGFIGFVPLPLFTSLTNILPQLSDVVNAMKNNKESWKNYLETEEDKEIYKDKSIITIQEVDSENGQENNKPN